MRLANDVRLGPYELLAALGSGGMGDVYKARDTRLDRTVAIKVLPEEFAADADRRERFEREARAIAVLNHPNICRLHDVGEASVPDQSSSSLRTVKFLVMEYLEGYTLAERLARGPLPLSEAIRCAIEIADALDHAHRRGLIHRDLKPSNVMMTRTGAKVLDFGLAKARSNPTLVGLSTISPESEAPLTEKGAILGTFPYMAPEQLGGHQPDQRADIFSFGATFYEMATGKRAFEGSTSATVIGAVLHTHPAPLSTMRPTAPPLLDRIVSRCLAKDPDDRWQTARDLMLELKWITEHGGAALGSPQVASTWGTKIRVAVVGVAIAAAAFAIGYLRGSPRDTAPINLAFSPPEGLTVPDMSIGGPVTISPDGRRLAFVAAGADGKRGLWIRTLDSVNALPIPGSEGAAFPFWSPDSRFVGFFAQRKLKRVLSSGGSPQTLCDAVQPGGGAMNQRGEIIFSAEVGRQLYLVPASGGAATPIPADGVNEERYWPLFLPDGRHFLYFGRPQRHGVYVAELGSSDVTMLLDDRVTAVYAPGYLLTLSGSARSEVAGTLMAYPFDATRLQLTGEALPVAEDVPYESGVARSAFSVSDNGTLVYGTNKKRKKDLIWFDREGRQLAAVGGGLRYGRPALSPDGKTVAVQGVDPETQQADLWLVDTARGIPSRFTSQPMFEDYPVWSPDGARIVFSSPRGGRPPNLYEKSLTGADTEEALFDPAFNHKPTDWSRDGRFIVFASRHPTRQWDLWLWPTESRAHDRKPLPIAQSEFNEQLGRISPDGQWIAFVSDESGTNEVYVQPFLQPGAKRRISASGGAEPKWRGDGRELFYLAADGHLVAVPVAPGRSLEIGSPTTLFKSRISDDFLYDAHYAVTDDGQRFLINTVTEDAAPATILLNWPVTLRSR